MSAISPVRYPDLRSIPLMTRRAWWLVVLNILIPGSAQLLAGNRKLGRFGVRATFTGWVILVVVGILALLDHSVIVAVATNTIALTLVQIVLALYALLWIVLTLDTLRLTRLIKTVPNGRILIAAVSVVVLVLTVGAAGYGSVAAGVARSALTSIFGGSQLASPSDGRYNILLLGGDAGDDRMGLRPDSTSVASIDAVTGKSTIIGIPRNLQRVKFAKGSPLWKPFPNGYNCGDQCLIDYLYTYAEDHPSLYPNAKAEGSSPGIEAMKDAVEGVTGLRVQYYGLIDMQGFADLIDALGGVTVDVPERTAIGGVTGSKPTGYIEAGKQKMNGATALWYARSRYNTNDFLRMEHQRLVQEAMLKQFQPSIVLTQFQKVAKAGVQVVKTDIPANALMGLVALGEKARMQPVTQLEIVPPFIDTAFPDFTKIKKAVQKANAPAAQ